MKRQQAREIALHLIFEMGFREFEEERLEERLDSEEMESLSEEGDMYKEKPDEVQLAYIRSVVKGVAADREAIDCTIEKYAKGRKVVRMSRMTVAILRLAIYEMRSVDDVPESVAINEAVELSKTYAAEESTKFINGILGSVSREKPDEP